MRTSRSAHKFQQLNRPSRRKDIEIEDQFDEIKPEGKIREKKSEKE